MGDGDQPFAGLAQDELLRRILVELRTLTSLVSEINNQGRDDLEGMRRDARDEAENAPPRPAG